MQLNNKIAVVTGAAGVLCSQFVEALLEDGASVALLGRTESKLIDLKHALAAKGFEKTLVVAADVLDEDALKSAKAKINAELGPIDILVNGAGGNKPGATSQAEQMTEDTPAAEAFPSLNASDFMDVFDLNFKGTFLPTQVFSEDMITQKAGSIVNISSVSAYLPLTKVAAYSSAKAAVESFTKWLSTHLAPINVRVNALVPGFYLTDQNRFLLTNEDGTMTPRGQKIINNTPMGRYGDAPELKSAIRFLCNPESGFVTGISLPVDGGFTAFAGV
jgi:NAD(P)-dependent dehydrogenase (short-subunit alcohol dehydrogenase family)